MSNPSKFADIVADVVANCYEGGIAGRTPTRPEIAKLIAAATITRDEQLADHLASNLNLYSRSPAFWRTRIREFREQEVS